jgi:EmrB/QacA subfamily drug resistance transporter
VSESRRKTLTLVATILGSTIVFLDSTVVNVALPAISDDLGAGLSDQQWIVEAYLLALVSLLLVGGSLGDQFGRRRIFMIGLAGFGITSFLCAIAPTTNVLIGARALQGFAGALLVPGSLAILATHFEGAERGKAVGTWTAWSGISTVLGPAGGGALVEVVSWRAIFWVNLPLIVITLFLARAVISETKDEDADRAIDWPGIGLSALGLGGPVFALIQQPDHGWGAPIVFVPLIAGICLFTGFLFWESRYRHAMLDLSLFKVRNFAVTNLETLIVYAGLIGATFFLALFLQQTADYTPLQAGLATTPISIVMFILSPRFGKIATGIGPRVPMSAGPIVAGLGMLLLTRVGAHPDYAKDLLPGLLVFSLGLSATVAPLTATALDSVDERHMGIASGINNGVARVAGLLAIAILGALIAGSYKNKIDDQVGGTSLSRQATAAIDDAKQRSLDVPDTSDLAPDDAALVVHATSQASEHSFHQGIELAGALMIVGGIIAGAGLRNPKRAAEEESHHLPAAPGAGECGRASQDCAGRGDRPAEEPTPAQAG